MTPLLGRGRRPVAVLSTVVTSLFLLGAMGCEKVSSLAPDPYEDLRDESVGLGAVDPFTFPPANLGSGGNRAKPGRGTFSEVRAYVGGEQIGYFLYAVNTPATLEPLRLMEDGAPYPGVSTPTVYAFDATDEEPVPEQSRCRPPEGWKPDPRVDTVSYKQQGNIFTALPTATYAVGATPTTTYVPVMAEAAIDSSKITCQSIKSEKGLVDRWGGRKPARTGRYLAWLMIDPGAAVFPMEDPKGAEDPAGIGLQRWGWYNRYLVAYLDGGYIPTVPVTVMEGPMGEEVEKEVLNMVPQRLYIPSTAIMAAMGMGAAKVGAGYDVLAKRRGEEGYSPVCQVYTYDAGGPRAAGALPKSEADIMALPNASVVAAMPPRYVYCLQVR